MSAFALPLPGPARERAAFRRLLGNRPVDRPVAGVEHEFTVTDGRRQVDFGSLVHELALGRRHLDPDDPNAYRLESGAVVTSDKREAEIALAPVDVAPGFSGLAVRRSALEATALRSRLPPGYELHGFSTHISVEVPEDLAVEVARLYVTRFGPAMMLAMDGPEAPGLRVRPRHRRLELCGDYVEGRRLAAALDLAAGSVAACIDALTAESPRSVSLPPPALAAVRPAIERPGWFIDQTSLGLTPGEAPGSLIRLAGGGHWPVTDHIAAASQAASAALGRLFRSAAPISEHLATRSIGMNLEPGPGSMPFGDVLRVRRRPGVDLAPVMVTWPVNVFLVTGSGVKKPAFAVVPREWLATFLGRFDQGGLDRPLRRYMTAHRGSRRASSWHDAKQPGLFDDLPSRLALLPPEPL